MVWARHGRRRIGVCISPAGEALYWRRAQRTVSVRISASTEMLLGGPIARNCQGEVQEWGNGEGG